MVHTDSQYALDGCQILQQCGSIPAAWCNQDLWEHVLQCLNLYDGKFTLKKVAAHTKLSDASTCEVAFCTRWNAVADKAAKIARLSGLSSRQNEVFQAFQNSNNWQSFWSRRCQEFLLALAVRAVGSPDGLVDQELPDPPGENEEAIFGVNDGTLIDAMPLDWRAALANNPQIVEFGMAVASTFVQWILDQALSAQYVRQLPFLELFIGFHFEVGVVLPIQIGVRRGVHRWIPVENSNAGALFGRTLGSQTGVIEWLVRRISDCCAGFDAGFVTVSRPCAAIHLPLRGCTLPISESTVARINATLNAMGRPIRHQRDFARAFP